jgi:hypothetical protein
LLQLAATRNPQSSWRVDMQNKINFLKLALIHLWMQNMHIRCL